MLGRRNELEHAYASNGQKGKRLYQLLRGEGLHFSVRKQNSTDTDADDSTGPQSVNQNLVPSDLLSKSQSTEHKRSGLQYIISQRKR